MSAQTYLVWTFQNQLRMKLAQETRTVNLTPERLSTLWTQFRIWTHEDEERAKPLPPLNHPST